MPTIPRSKAVKLLSASEFRLYEQSRRGHVDDHGATRLRQLIQSARKLSDKYRDLKRRQKAEAARKRKPQGLRAPQGNESTQLKKDVFDDILQRFEDALERAEARAEPEKPPRRAVRKVKRSKRASAAEAKPRAAAKTARKPPRTARRAAAKASRKASGAKAKPDKATAPDAASVKHPVGSERTRKQLAAGKRAASAHARSRGRRKQAKRDSR